MKFYKLTEEDIKFLSDASERMQFIEDEISSRLDGAIFNSYQDYEDVVGNIFEEIDKEFHDKLCCLLAKIPGMLFQMWRDLRNGIRERSNIRFEGNGEYKMSNNITYIIERNGQKIVVNVNIKI